MTTATVQRPPRNGVDVPTLFATLDAVKGQPEIAHFQFRATNEWISGTHNRSTIQGFYGAGQEDTTRTSPFTYDADHPAVLVGTNNGPTPVEFLLHAIAACLTSGLANIAAARGVTLHRVRSTVEGDIDLLGILGLPTPSATATGRSGCRSRSRVTRPPECWPRSSSSPGAAPPSTTSWSTAPMWSSTSPPLEVRRGWDVVVVGARVAGAATAMLLAREGLRVLFVDRSRYGSDTLSTHALMRGGVLQLQRWGLLSRVAATGAPPIRRVTFHYGHDSMPVSLKPYAGVEALYAPRRTILDALLVRAGEDSGARFRFGLSMINIARDFTGRVVGVIVRDHLGATWTEQAGLVVGADGRGSLVARQVSAPTTIAGGHAAAYLYGTGRCEPVRLTAGTTAMVCPAA